MVIIGEGSIAECECQYSEYTLRHSVYQIHASENVEIGRVQGCKWLHPFELFTGCRTVTQVLCMDA
jgi:hypothetical protein